MNRVVVTGLGMVTPLGETVEQNWSRALNGENGISRLERPEFVGAPVAVAGQVSEGSWSRIAERFPDEVRSEGERRTLFALWAAAEALRDAGSNSCGVVLGAGLGAVRLEDFQPFLGSEGAFDWSGFAQSFDRVHAQSLLRWPSDRATALIAHRFDLTGPILTITSACASATQAIGTAYRMIQRGEAEMMLCGGTDSMMHPVGLVYFALLGAASTSADPDSACRPFDSRRSGMVIGEGAGLIMLESERHARSRGAGIYAELAGYGSSMDGFQPTAPHPEGAGAARAMTNALADAGLTASAIDSINAHGTGTRLNDVAESRAINTVFGDTETQPVVSSSKSLMGHLLAGCGGPELVLTILSVSRDAVHPTRNLSRPDRRCDLNFVSGKARYTPVRAALSNSFGFGGQNACVIVKKNEGGPGSP
ncbi:MAG: beta-ketoacyl-[acyl-carrier-protein] synthase family protein [Thermoanaerobaculales bacterium]|nr:beta-ketoacyl-[acyl-carrier-protein] synthase family protein [Thermoanaerobaculales bacterium]